MFRYGEIKKQVQQKKEPIEELFSGIVEVEDNY